MRRNRRSAIRKKRLNELEKGIGSDYLRQLSGLIKDSQKVRGILYGRESRDNGNLSDQVKQATEELESLGVEIIATFKEVQNGSIYNLDRTEFFKAFEVAKLHNAILVAPSRERIIRSKNYNGNFESDQPTVAEYNALQVLADGVTIATILHPDEFGRSKETKRGQQAKGNKGGRPPKEKPKTKPHGKVRREAYLPLVLEMHKVGFSLRIIAAELNAMDDGFPDVCHKTISNWIKEELG
ncbi:MAG: recombinase family protein [Planctomycetaceae bacterium]|nr:recombinase family protein [Planctomycetaceae bacterium]